MKPGVVGAALVLAFGGAAGGAVVLRDASQLARARRAADDAGAALGKGDLDGARRGWVDALVAADAVGGLTGKRPAALDVADQARAGLLLLDGLADAEARPLAALRLAGGPEALASAPAARPVIDRVLAERLVDAGLALEARALEAPAALALAPRVLGEAAAAARAAGSPRADAAAQALERARLRASLARCEAEVRADRDQDVLAELAGLEAALQAAAAAFPEAEGAELRGRIAAVLGEAADLAATRAFARDVELLARQVPTDALGALRKAAEALRRPPLMGKHARAEAFAAELGKADARLARVREAAAAFEGMVLVDQDRRLFIDATEVTNEAYARFVAAGGYAADAAWWPDEARRLLERFVDATGRPGPRTWKEGAPPPGKADHPVTGVSALEAQAYAAWAGKRVPTLDEWRAAAGAATYPWGNAWSNGNANLKGSGPDDTERVGSHPGGRSPCGALDLVGNAREVVLVPGAKPVVVGGSFQVLPAQATLEAKLEVPPTSRATDTGFRCVRTLAWD